MANKFGRIEYSDNHFVEQTFHKAQTLTSASEGTHYFQYKKDNYSDRFTGGLGTLSTDGSHWAFLHGMFYLSGSSKVNIDERDKFNSIYHNFNQHNDLKPHYNHKFYDSGSVFYIPQQRFGERIKPGSFQITARSGSSYDITKQIKIVDDSNGNLYSTNAEHSQSVGALSSSGNYVGNIFYDLGIAVVAETGSWSGSIDYTDIGQPDKHEFWDLRFNSTTPIFTHTYSIKIPQGEFNRTMNATTRIGTSGSVLPGTNIKRLANMRNELTGSEWSPYFNQIQLFRDDDGEAPLILANLPRNIKVRDDMDLTITFRIDY